MQRGIGRPRRPCCPLTGTRSSRCPSARPETRRRTVRPAPFVRHALFAPRPRCARRPAVPGAPGSTFAVGTAISLEPRPKPETTGPRSRSGRSSGAAAALAPKAAEAQQRVRLARRGAAAAAPTRCGQDAPAAQRRAGWGEGRAPAAPAGAAGAARKARGRERRRSILAGLPTESPAPAGRADGAGSLCTDSSAATTPCAAG